MDRKPSAMGFSLGIHVIGDCFRASMLSLNTQRRVVDIMQTIHAEHLQTDIFYLQLLASLVAVGSPKPSLLPSNGTPPAPCNRITSQYLLHPTILHVRARLTASYMLLHGP